MKTFYFKSVLTSLIILFSTMAFTLKGPDELAAPVYPGAMIEPNSQEPRPNAEVYYTKEGFEKVRDFYKEIYGSSNLSDCNDKRCIVEIIEKKETGEVEVDENGEETDVPLIEEKKYYVTIVAGDEPGNNYVNQALAQLQNAYIGKFTGISQDEKLKRKNDPELKSVIKQYNHLKESFFLKTLKKDSRGNNMGIEAILYEKFFASPEEVRSKKMNELQEKYITLVEQGKIEEATKVSEKMESLSRARVETEDKWENAIRYLQELNKLAYSTKIIIDKK